MWLEGHDPGFPIGVLDFFEAYFQGRTLVKLVQKCSVLAFFSSVTYIPFLGIADE